jgi:hypothetical protein
MDFTKYQNTKYCPAHLSASAPCPGCGKSVKLTVEKSHFEKKVVFTAIDKFCSECGYRIAELATKRQYEYQEAIDAYRMEESRLSAAFVNDAIEAVGLKDHPKAGKAFSFAWELGHSAGYSEVFSYLQSIAEVLL